MITSSLISDLKKDLEVSGKKYCECRDEVKEFLHKHLNVLPEFQNNLPYKIKTDCSYKNVKVNGEWEDVREIRVEYVVLDIYHPDYPEKEKEMFGHSFNISITPYDIEFDSGTMGFMSKSTHKEYLILNAVYGALNGLELKENYISNLYNTSVIQGLIDLDEENSNIWNKLRYEQNRIKNEKVIELKEVFKNKCVLGIQLKEIGCVFSVGEEKIIKLTPKYIHTDRQKYKKAQLEYSFIQGEIKKKENKK